MNHKNWTKQRNKVNRMVLAAKNKSDCQKAKGNSAKMWKVINKATNRTTKSNVTPDYIEVRTADFNIHYTSIHCIFIFH